MLAQYVDFSALIQEKLGLHFDNSKERDLTHRIQAAMHSTSITDVHLFLARLREEPLQSPLWITLIQKLTVNETYFFRDASQFSALRHHILPRLIQQRRQENFLTLRLWSAGCSTGEEPYSLAILLHQLLPDLANWTILILGTDINRDSLSIAEKGFYTRHAFRNETPESIQFHYFQPDGKGFRLLPAIRKMVRFASLNLVEDAYPSPTNFTGNLDLILCRNVTIYFERPTTQQVITRFRHSLAPDGWLVVGHSEPMLNFYEGFKPCNFEGAVVYQKMTQTQQLPPLAVPFDPVPLQVNKQVNKPVPAVASVKKQIERSTPISAQACYEKGKAFADRMAWQEANEWLTRALSLNPLMLEAHFTRAMVYLHEGDHSAALEALQRALYLDRNFVLGHFNLGLIHWRSGRKREAIRAWNTTRDLIGDDMLQILPHSDGVTSGYLLSMIDMYLNDGRSE